MQSTISITSESSDTLQGTISSSLAVTYTKIYPNVHDIQETKLEHTY